MAAHMGRDFGEFFLVNLVVLLHSVVKVMFPMHRHHREFFLIQEQETRIPLNDRLLHRCFSVCQDSLETGIHLILHRQHSCACVGLCGFNVLGAIPSALELVVNMNGLILHIQVIHSQTHKLGNSHTRIEQDIHTIIIFAIMLVLFDKGQEFALLVSGDSFSGDRIVDDNLCQLKVKGILADVVILHRHSKCRAKNTTDAVNRTITPLVLFLQLD